MTRQLFKNKLVYLEKKASGEYFSIDLRDHWENQKNKNKKDEMREDAFGVGNKAEPGLRLFFPSQSWKTEKILSTFDEFKPCTRAYKVAFSTFG